MRGTAADARHFSGHTAALQPHRQPSSGSSGGHEPAPDPPEPACPVPTKYGVPLPRSKERGRPEMVKENGMSVVAMAITRLACWSRSGFGHRPGGRGTVFGARPARHAKRLLIGLTGALVLAVAVVAAPSAQAADDLGYSQLENRHKNWG